MPRHKLPPGPGRPRGARNKLTRSAKEAFQLAFDTLGGAAGLVRWAQTNPDDFYKLYARLIPAEVNAKVESRSLDAILADMAAASKTA